MVSLKWDVSEHQKDQRSSMTGDALGTDPSNVSLVKIVKSTLSIPFELPTVPGAFPPQPVDSPPATPPLTSSLPRHHCSLQSRLELHILCRQPNWNHMQFRPPQVLPQPYLPSLLSMASRHLTCVRVQF